MKGSQAGPSTESSLCVSDLALLGLSKGDSKAHSLAPKYTVTVLTLCPLSWVHPVTRG